VDLSNYDGFSTLYVRFAFVTDWTNNYDGWYIDDVAVTAASSSYDGTEYRFLNGTSMAAPHVAGVAALVKGENSLLTAADIKSIIAGTVDLKPFLDGILASGGRLNAFGAITAVLDTDNDGIPQSLDNCTAVANADQRDTDGDGYGNLCDGDLNNDGSTNTLDLQLYAGMHATQAEDPEYDPDADFDGNSSIDTSDLNIYEGLHRRPPGPSCCGD